MIGAIKLLSGAVGFLAVFCSAGLATDALAQSAQRQAAPVPSPDSQTADPQASAPFAKRGQQAATVNAPLQLLGVPVRVEAPDPVSYSGSAYQDDLSGQSESNSDPAITDSVRETGPSIPDAW